MDGDHIIQNIVKSVTTMSDVLKKLKYRVDRKSLETIYFTFMRPKLEYGCHIWANCNDKDSSNLERLQLDVARTISGARKGTSTDSIYSELNWQSLERRREGIKMRSFSKIVDKSLPNYLCDILPGTVGRSLRNSNNIKSFKCRTETFMSSFIPSSIKMWNTLPQEHRNSGYINQSLSSYSSSDLFNYGKRETSVKLAQLRMKCSKLNAHLFSLHVMDSAACTCGFDLEDTNHYLFHCPLFTLERNILYNSFNDLDFQNLVINEEILIRGGLNLTLDQNVSIFKIVFKFIESTSRL